MLWEIMGLRIAKLSHTSNNNRRKVVPLRFRFVQGGQDLELRHDQHSVALSPSVKIRSRETLEHLERRAEPVDHSLSCH